MQSRLKFLQAAFLFKHPIGNTAILPIGIRQIHG
mgnify:CR=1 FL=1